MCTVAPRSQLTHECDEVLLLLRRQLCLQDQVEELHDVLEREQPAIVQMRPAVLDAS